MIYKDLSAWITNSEGEPLEEFKQRVIEENTVECWIPSTEGSNFQIHWQPIRNFIPNLGLRCRIRLDGRKVSRGHLDRSYIARGIPGVKTGMSITRDLKRRYVFGSRQLTDRDDLASPNDPTQDSLGTIRTILSWVKDTDTVLPWEPNRNPAEASLVHERAAKKAHSSAVGLGNPTRTLSTKTTSRVKQDVGLPEVVFVFRYGERDWLRAQDIIEDPQPVNGIASALQRVKKDVKREQSAAQSIAETLRSDSHRDKGEQPQGLQEVIDIDDLASDNGSDVVVLNDSVELKRVPSETEVDAALNRESSQPTASLIHEIAHAQG